jgi:methionyl-tRNA formyltransferase
MKTIFIGNRFRVLEKMLNGNYEPLTIFAVHDSFLERELNSRAIEYTRIDNKAGLVSMLKDMDYELLVSNGCPFLLPVSRLDTGTRKFINVHPALLPEQRGPHAVNAAILYQYGAGATCHIMDDSADTGPVISRVEIPYSPDLDLGLLYQLSFTAEVDAFTMAESHSFRPIDTPLQGGGESICFSRQGRKPELDLTAGLEDIYYQIRAFGISSQGVTFHYSGKSYQVFDAEIISNAYLLSRVAEYRQNEVVYIYGDTLVLRKGNGFVKLKALQGDLDHIRPGLLLK